MRPLGVLLGLLVALGGILAVVSWHRSGVQQQRAGEYPRFQSPTDGNEDPGRQASAQPTKVATPKAALPEPPPMIEPRPAVADKGPFPKAAIGDRGYVFGRMAINEERKHTFRIENKGQAPLLLAKGPTECKCTISNLSNHSVAPGGFAEIQVDWKPREADQEFEKTAIIWTNDPKLSEIHFTVAGKVTAPLEVLPRNWNAGNVTEDQDGKAVGTVASELGGPFKILSIVPADPNLTVNYKPMSAGDLARTKMSAGYEFTVTVGKGVRLGRFRSLLKVATSVPGKESFDVEVTALRTGPIRFLPAVAIVGFGYWDSEKLLLNMGRFRHENGSKTALPALVYAMKDKFQVLGVKSSDSFVKVSLEPSPQIGGNPEQQGVRFVFEIPPGSPPVNYMTRKPVHVTVATNHPQLKDLDFDLQFVSR